MIDDLKLKEYIASVKQEIKDAKTQGRNIYLRLAGIDDAQFILDLRLNENKNKFISKTIADLKLQEEYIDRSQKAQDEFYFVILSNQDQKLGSIRVYDLCNDSFCWGSWIVKEDAPYTTALESFLLIYEFCFYKLKYEKAHFDVRKENEKVVSFHLKSGATIISEDELNFYLNYHKEAYENFRKKYLKFLQF